jgi:hypothetical protein
VVSNIAHGSLLLASSRLRTGRYSTRSAKNAVVGARMRQEHALVGVGGPWPSRFPTAARSRDSAESTSATERGLASENGFRVPLPTQAQARTACRARQEDLRLLLAVARERTKAFEQRPGPRHLARCPSRRRRKCRRSSGTSRVRFAIEPG